MPLRLALCSNKYFKYHKYKVYAYDPKIVYDCFFFLLLLKKNMNQAKTIIVHNHVDS